MGDGNQPLHWQREKLNQVLWKFLADHTGHRIDVRLDHQMTNDSYGYQEIGGDSENSLTYDLYLAGWPGLNVCDR
jgi:hypothetical protein